jgi:hypothetical protein
MDFGMLCWVFPWRPFSIYGSQFLLLGRREGGVLVGGVASSPPPSLQGAPESVIERCCSVRVGSRTVPLNTTSREQILAKIRDWGSGSDTLRCLALATRDQPPRKEDMQLDDTSKFVQYEVGAGSLVSPCSG